MRRLPNIITLCRLVLCAAAFFVLDSRAFIVLYLLAGVSDVADGFAARRLNAVSVTGARLDSAADLVLAALAVTFLACSTALFESRWVWWAVGLIALLRGANLVLIRSRYGLWASTHTILNKLSGVVLFATVPVAWFAGTMPTWFAAAVTATAFAASTEETAIILSSKSFDLDRKSLKS